MGVDPTTLMLVSGGMKAAGAYEQAGQQRDALSYQASVSTRNAQIAQENASQAQRDGQAATEDQQLKTASTYGAQRAALAANGVDLGEGSPLDVLASTKFMGARDANRIQNEAVRRAWGYSMQSQGLVDEAQHFHNGANSVNPLMSAATSLLGSATQFNAINYQKKKAGV